MRYKASHREYFAAALAIATEPFSHGRCKTRRDGFFQPHAQEGVFGSPAITGPAHGAVRAPRGGLHLLPRRASRGKRARRAGESAPGLSRSRDLSAPDPERERPF